MRRLTTLLGFTVLSVGGISCGSRTGLDPGVDTSIAGSCTVTDDCVPVRCRVVACVEGRCKDTPFECEANGDPCLKNVCSNDSGRCEPQSLVVDADGDGFMGPRPGFAPGTVDACGDDCDDTSALAHPGNAESCDGKDNDCDGTVDNGSRYFAADSLVNQGLFQVGRLPNSGRASIAGTDSGFALGYWVDSSDMHPYLRGLRPDGTEIFAETMVTSSNATGFGPTVVSAGKTLGLAWNDAREDQNYEIYFARFDSFGKKLGPDLRVTNVPGFSINNELFFDQGQYAVVFDDDRFGIANIFAQLISADGVLLGENIALTDGGLGAELPTIAATPDRFGVAYLMVNGFNQGVAFRSFDKKFSPLSAPVTFVTANAKSPRIAALGNEFLITWDEAYADAAGKSIWGSVVDEAGNIIVPPRPITSGAVHARSHSTYSLGNRVILVWADDADGNYEIYGKVLDPRLNEVEPRTRLTIDPANSINPQVALTSEGRLGIFFDDFRSGVKQAYLTTLQCSVL